MMMAFLALASSGIFSFPIVDALRAWWLHRRDVMSDVHREFLRLRRLARRAGIAATIDFNRDFYRRR